MTLSTDAPKRRMKKELREDIKPPKDDNPAITDLSQYSWTIVQSFCRTGWTSWSVPIPGALAAVSGLGNVSTISQARNRSRD